MVLFDEVWYYINGIWEVEKRYVDLDCVIMEAGRKYYLVIIDDSNKQEEETTETEGDIFKYQLKCYGEGEMGYEVVNKVVDLKTRH